jgi:hypothetical protein
VLSPACGVLLAAVRTLFSIGRIMPADELPDVGKL